MNWSRRSLLVALSAPLALTGYLCWTYLFQWEARRALPWSATDIQEWSWKEWPFRDYSYHLKAKITETQFHQYIPKFDLTPHTPSRRYDDGPEPWLAWRQSGPNWWDPSESLDHTFVHQDGYCWTFAKYERGYLYFTSLEHLEGPKMNGPP